MDNKQAMMQHLLMLFANCETPTKVELISYERKLGIYAHEKVLEAARYFHDNRHTFKPVSTKRWPYVGELQDILKNWYIQPMASNALPSPTSLDAAIRQYSAFYREWVIGIPDEIKMKTDDAAAFRLIIRHSKWGEMVKSWLKEDKSFSEKWEGAPFYKHAALFYQAGGAEQYKEWMRHGDDAEFQEHMLAMMKTKEGNIKHALNR